MSQILAVLWALVDRLFSLSVPATYRAAWDQAKQVVSDIETEDPAGALVDSLPLLSCGVELLAAVLTNNSPERAFAGLQAKIAETIAARVQVAQDAQESEGGEPAPTAAIPPAAYDPRPPLSLSLPHVPDTQPEGGPLLTDEVLTGNVPASDAWRPRFPNL